MEDIVEKLRKALAAGIDDEIAKQASRKIWDAFDEAEDQFVWRIKDDLAGHLSAWVRECAEKAITAILSGDETAVRRYLLCSVDGWNDRTSVKMSFDGNLYEPAGVELRRKIVDACAGILLDEYTTDVVAKLNVLKDENHKLKVKIIQLNDDIRSATR